MEEQLAYPTEIEVQGVAPLLVHQRLIASGHLPDRPLMRWSALV